MKAYKRHNINFWDYMTRTETGCWEWQGSRDKRGYGRMTINGKSKFTHRHALELTNGELDPKILVCHKCDNPPCCNPAHLFEGTYRDNRVDSVNKGRAVFTPLCGEANPRAKLTRSDVLAIREIYAQGGTTQKALAQRYGVDPALIRRVILRTAWKEV